MASNINSCRICLEAENDPSEMESIFAESTKIDDYLSIPDLILMISGVVVSY